MVQLPYIAFDRQPISVGIAHPDQPESKPAEHSLGEVLE
jgi:hypothetical protein